LDQWENDMEIHELVIGMKQLERQFCADPERPTMNRSGWRAAPGKPGFQTTIV